MLPTEVLTTSGPFLMPRANFTQTPCQGGCLKMTVAHVRTFIAVMGFINVPVFRPSVWPWVTFPMRLT